MQASRQKALHLLTRRVFDVDRDFSNPEPSFSLPPIFSAVSKEEKTLSADEVWNSKLKSSSIDSGVVNDILSLQRFVDTFVEKAQNTLANQLSDKFHNEDLSVADLQSLFDKANDLLSENVDTAVKNYLSSITKHADKAALERVPGPVPVHSGVAEWLKKAIDKALSAVKSIGKVDKARVRDKLKDPSGVDAITRDLLKKKEEGIERQSVPPAQIKLLVKDLWKGIGSMKRVVRTETLEVYLRTQLNQWYAQGVRKVRWRIVRDGRSCHFCQALDGQVFEIKKLLKQKYIHMHSHPNSLISGTFISMIEGKKKVEDVRLFDKVKLPEGSFRANGVLPHPWEGNLVEVNRILTATDYHTIYFVRNGKVYKGKMDELREGDFLLKEKKCRE